MVCDAALPSGTTERDRIDAAAALAAGTTNGTFAENIVVLGSSRVPTLVHAARLSARAGANAKRLDRVRSMETASKNDKNVEMK
jgi:hypothetical protein